MTDRRLAIDAWESLFRAQHEVFGDVSGDFDATALSQAEYDVLLTVTRGEGMTARLRDVTANMLISQPSVSRLVDRMAVRGLISKCPDPEDGRGSLVRATPDGAATFRRVASTHGRSIAERMSTLDDAELAQLRDLTAKLRKTQESC
jgi:DNA-binding MarR family transcriptional regulator